VQNPHHAPTAEPSITSYFLHLKLSPLWFLKKKKRFRRQVYIGSTSMWRIFFSKEDNSI
jgi:hypothetical protein